MSEKYHTQFLLDDFFPLYVKETDKNDFYTNSSNEENLFYNSVMMKSEFGELRPYYGEPKPKKGEFLRHQEFMSRFMSPYTPYDKMLVFQGLGTGKTFTLAAVSELSKKIKTNELSRNKIIILVRNPNLRNNMVAEIANAFGYAPSKEEIDEESLSDKAIATRINKRIGVNYQVETFTTFVNQIKLMSDEQIKEDYSNCYILIDEAHNLRTQSSGKKDDRKNYEQIHRLLHLVLGCKILLLTATPMRDKPSEICSLLNLLLPLKKQLDRKNFNENYFDEKQFKENKKAEFKNYVKGIVSYLRSSTSDVQVEYAGDIDKSSDMQFTKTARLQMSDFQSNIYKEAFLKDKPNDEGAEIDIDEEDFEKSGGDSGIWLNSRQAAMFVFPDGTYGIQKVEKRKKQSGKPKITIETDSESSSSEEEEKEDVKEPWLYEEEKIYKPSSRLIRYFHAKGNSKKDMLEQLKKYSAKFYFVIKEILKNPREKFFVYSNIVSGGGALLFGAILEIFGLKHVEPASNSIDTLSQSDRYMVLTGSTLSSAQTDVLVNRVFNDPRNKYGEYIRVIVGSHVVGEGLSFKHIRKMCVLTPFWNSPTTDQAIGRAIRSFSHNDLPQDQQNVVVYRIAAIPLPIENVQSIDMLMYKVSEDKDIKIKQVERLLKESAVDCALNRERNIISTDKPFSKECDYLEECNYRCEFVDDKYYSVDWVGERVQDTYNLYYAREEINKVKIIVKEAFSMKFTYDFEDLYEMILTQIIDLSPIVLARALNEIITYNNPIINRFGFETYLREDRNLFFLIDDPFSPSLYTSAYYTANPEPDEGFQSFEEIIINYQYDKIERILDIIIRNQRKTNLLDKIFTNLSLHLTQQIVEIFLLAYFNKSIKNKTLQEYIYQKYGSFISKIDDDIFLVIDTDNIKVLEQQDEGFEWVDVSEEIKEKLEKQKKTKLAELEKTDWGYFGYLFQDKGKERFTIRIVGDYSEKKEGGVDKRTEREGLTCGTGKLSLKGLIPMGYDLIEKAVRFNKLPPNFKSSKSKTYTTDEIMSREYFKKYLENVILLNTMSSYLDRLSQQDINNLSKMCYNAFSSFKKTEQKLLKDLVNENTKKLNDSTKIIEFIKKAPRDSLLEHIGTDASSSYEIIKNFKENPLIRGIIRDNIEKLPQSSKDNLGALISDKTGVAICAILKDWFKENKLLIEGIK